jgi:antitoxin (DNA-binding transcriptional repressor) of toxin-antitoxin stability system
MLTIPIEEAISKLAELIDQTPPGEAVVITRNDQPIAELLRLPLNKPRPVPGRGKGMLIILADDDEHLKDWADYMP